MVDEKEVLDSIEEDQVGHAFVPDPVRNEAFKLAEEYGDLDPETVDEALEVASTYWREFIEDSGLVQSNPQGVRIEYRDMSTEYQVRLARDIRDELGEEIERETALTDLAYTLSSMPEDEEVNDPRNREEGTEFPSMFY